jgi:hypothetical protein
VCARGCMCVWPCVSVCARLYMCMAVRVHVCVCVCVCVLFDSARNFIFKRQCLLPPSERPSSTQAAASTTTSAIHLCTRGGHLERHEICQGKTMVRAFQTGRGKGWIGGTHHPLLHLYLNLGAQLKRASGSVQPSFQHLRGTAERWATGRTARVSVA